VRIVVAVGGNALLRRDEPPDAAVQRHHVQAAAAALAPLTESHELVLVHGNGPQVGLLAVQSSADPSLSEPYPLDVLGAQTQGMIGYWFAQALHDAGVRRPVLVVVTQTVVSAQDPAFAAPTKPVGAVMTREHAVRQAHEHRWTVRSDGDQWRRVVPSPEPLRVVELASIAALVDARTVVVCGGGGGVPVVESADGGLRGVEAVVDKDLTAALLAQALDAERLVLLTDVAGVLGGFGTPAAALLPMVRAADVDGLELAAGSMGPKVQACLRFALATGRPAVIGALDDAAAVVAGTAGTTVTA
jgi:carbamate kinase